MLRYMSKTQTLQCKAGHEWSRPSQKGKRPFWCPKHRPATTTVAKTQTLTCRAGHDWTRPSAKGKPPVWCPKHKPVVLPIVVEEISEPMLRTVKVVVSKYETPEDVLEILTQPNPLDPEAVHKLEYIETQLGSGRREQKDILPLMETRRLILDRLKRASA